MRKSNKIEKIKFIFFSLLFLFILTGCDTIKVLKEEEVIDGIKFQVEYEEYNNELFELNIPKENKFKYVTEENFNDVFSKYDLIIGPTTTDFAYKLGSASNDAVKSFMDDLFTIPVNMAGLPAMSLPIGFASNNLPVGMQIIANKFDEAKIYKLANFIENKINEGGN